MKAVRVNAFGEVDQLELVELPEPEPQAGQVRIRVEAAGLNYADVMQRKGAYPGGPQPPFISGFEVSGVVDAVGNDATLPVGTRVMAMTGVGAQAERVCVNAAACIPFPESMSFVEAAAFPVQYLTAYHALITLGRAAAGETVLIHAAAGGVGTAAIQIAKVLGLRVAGTASSARGVPTRRAGGNEKTPRSRVAPRGETEPGSREASRRNYFLSAFLSPSSFLLLVSFLAGSPAAGAGSAALAIVQDVGSRTARATKTTRTSFM